MSDSPTPLKRDFLGQSVNVGDVLVYPVRHSTSCDLKLLLVEAVTTEQVTGHNPEGRRVNVKKTENAVCLPMSSGARLAVNMNSLFPFLGTTKPSSGVPSVGNTPWSKFTSRLRTTTTSPQCTPESTEDEATE